MRSKARPYRTGQAVLDLCLLLVNLCTAAILAVLLLFISWPMALLMMAGVVLAGLAMRWLIARSQRVVARSRTAAPPPF